MGLSLEKKSELVRLNLEKRKVPTGIKMAVKVVTDVSGSMQGMFNNGTMQELFDRLIPVAMRFDDNGELDSFAFSDRAMQVKPITAKDFGNYVVRFKQEALPVMWGGTSYSRAFEELSKAAPKKSSGFFGGLFSKKAPEDKSQPSYVMFITDGDTMGDESQTKHLLKEMANDNVYVQMIGVGRGSSFHFLKEMADIFEHVGYVTFPDLSKTSDEQMYEQLLGEELCNWIKKQ